MTDPVQAMQPNPAPNNVDAEMALIGGLLFNNDYYDLIENLRPQDFYEPLLQRIYAEIETNVRRGLVSDPVLIGDRFAQDEAFVEYGGLRFLLDLIENPAPRVAIRDYARSVADFSLRRQLIDLLGDARENALDQGRDAKEWLSEVEQALFGLAEHSGETSGFAEFGEAVDGALDMAAEAYGRDGEVSGIATGLIDLDRQLGGLHPSDLIILAGRPSMGKTALATNIAYNVAKAYRCEPLPDGSAKTVRGGRVGFFSLEMSQEQLALRLLADVSGISGDRIRKGQIDTAGFSRLRDAGAEIRSIPLKIDDTGGIAIGKLAARARRLKRKHGLDLLVIDYLQLITGSDAGRKGGRVQEVSEITAALKALAKELSVPVLALSQLSRQVETRDDKRPQLSDLRESGTIEQDADVVMFVYREAYYVGRAEPKPGGESHLEWEETMSKIENLADVIVGKQRHGPIGTVTLQFNGELTRFSNLAREERFGGNAYNGGRP